MHGMNIKITFLVFGRTLIVQNSS